MKKTLLTPLLAILASLSLGATSSLAQTTKISAQTATGFGAKTPLFDAIAGKFNLTANVGYVYNFANDWGGGDVVGKTNGGLGYGGRIGWTNNSGFGVSADYLGFASKWKNDFEVTNNYHVVTFTPSYRISFGAAKEWGLKLGLGIGFSLADVSWAGNKATATAVSGSRVAGGALYKSTVAAGQLVAGCGAAAITPSVLNVFYGDSAGGSGSTPRNGCLDSNGIDHAGLSDAGIADRFNQGTGTAKSVGGGLVFVNDSLPVAYGVWRRLFATTADKAGEFATATNFETYAAFVTRCRTGACEGQTANINAVLMALMTAVQGGENATETATRVAETAKATCLTDKGPGAIINAAGVCRSTIEQTADAADAALAACITEKGAGSTIVGGQCTAPVASKAKDDAGFVLAPEISLEYDNGLFHADINARYIHELFSVKYDGQNGAADQLQKSGPLAVFIGAGIGVNF